VNVRPADARLSRRCRTTCQAATTDAAPRKDQRRMGLPWTRDWSARTRSASVAAPGTQNPRSEGGGPAGRRTRELRLACRPRPPRFLVRGIASRPLTPCGSPDPAPAQPGVKIGRGCGRGQPGTCGPEAPEYCPSDYAVGVCTGMRIGPEETRAKRHNHVGRPAPCAGPGTGRRRKKQSGAILWNGSPQGVNRHCDAGTADPASPARSPKHRT